MSTVTGVFESQTDAQQAVGKLSATGLSREKIVLLLPGRSERMGGRRRIPTSDTEQPGMGSAMGGVLGGAVGVASGMELGMVASTAIPGVGPVIAVGLLGAAVLGLAGAGVGVAAGSAAEDAMTTGLPADEWFVYEDALQQGRSVVLTFPDKREADSVARILEEEGAESIDAALHQWWIGLRGAEREHYVATGRDFDGEEQIYRLGFEAALHADTRCRKSDQTLPEMEARLEELRRQYRGAQVEEPYRRGFERGRSYYQSFCNREKSTGVSS